MSSIQLLAKSNQLNGWKASPLGVVGKITKVKEEKRNKKVIHLEGDGTKSSYLYTFSNSSKALKKLTWEMLYLEDFVIMVDVETLQGKRVLIYTPSGTYNDFQYGLGRHSISREWVKHTRDLEQDIKLYEPNNELMAVKKFVIRGSGFIDNLMLIKDKNSLNPKGKSKERVKQSTPKKFSLPVMKLLGDNPLKLKRGEQYREPGVIAQDVDGTTLFVNMSNDINSKEDGQYTVVYLATNSVGDSVVDRRIVIVGEGESQKESVSEEESIEPPEDDLLEEDNLMEKEKYEYPERPGL